MAKRNLVKEFGKDFSFKPNTYIDNSLGNLINDCRTVMTIQFEQWCNSHKIDLTDVDYPKQVREWVHDNVTVKIP